MSKGYIIYNIAQLVLFIGFFELIAIALKKAFLSTEILRNDAGQITRLNVSSIIIFPFFMIIQAIWLLSFSYSSSISSVELLGLGAFIILWAAVWLLTQLLIFPKWLHHLNSWLLSRSEQELIKAVRLTIGLILLFIIAIVIVVKFQCAI